MTAQKNRLNKWLSLAAVIGMIAGFAILFSEIQEAQQGQIETITSVDHFVHQEFLKIRTHQFDRIATEVTAFGSITVLTFLVLIIGFAFLINRRLAEALHFFIAGICTALFTYFLKSISKIPRPDKYDRLVQAFGFSFPSGHTLAASGIYLTLALLINRHLKNPILKILNMSAFIILILSIGISRLYLGVHYLSDVVGGLLIGISWAILLCQFPHFFINLAAQFLKFKFISKFV